MRRVQGICTLSSQIEFILKSYQGINHHIHQRGKEASLSSQLIVGITDSPTQNPPQHVAKHDANNIIIKYLEILQNIKLIATQSESVNICCTTSMVHLSVLKHQITYA